MDMNANQQPVVDTGIAARLVMPFAALLALLSASCCVLPIGLSILGLGGAWLTMLGPFIAYRGFILVGCRDCPRLGVVSGAASQAMRNAQAVCNCLDVIRIHRLFDRAVFAALGGVSAAFYVGFVEIDTMKNKLLALGVGGTILAILCCFTPLLPVVLTALGLTGLLGVVYSDAVLLPILAGFLILTGYAIWRQKTQK